MNLRNYLIIFSIFLLLFSCTIEKRTEKKGDKWNILTTTSIVQDLVKEIGKDKVKVRSLMGTGVDPHYYRASESDVLKLFTSDIIIYSGLHLEAKLSEMLKKLQRKKEVFSLVEETNKELFIESTDFNGFYDPHFWMDISLWKKSAEIVAKRLSKLDKENESYYEERLKEYLEKLKELEEYLENKSKLLKEKERILVTAHDAFSYFARNYAFKVVSLQGINTSSKAGIKDVSNLVNYIISNEIKAIFVESSISGKSLEAVKEGVKAQGKRVEIGGTLYTDTLGDKDSKADTYILMMKKNMNTIVNALRNSE